MQKFLIKHRRTVLEAFYDVANNEFIVKNKKGAVVARYEAKDVIIKKTLKGAENE